MTLAPTGGDAAAHRPAARLLGAAVVGDRIYLVGGYDGAAEFDTCDTYDPTTGAIAHRSPMAQQRGDLAVIAVANTCMPSAAR